MAVDPYDFGSLLADMDAAAAASAGSRREEDHLGLTRAQAAQREFFSAPQADLEGASTYDRFVGGSFSSPAETEAYLRRRYGDSVRAAGDGNWTFTDEAGKRRQYNPEGLDWRDVPSVFTDIAEGVGQTLGYGGGAIAGAAGGPVGSLAGAVAGGTAGGALGKEAAQGLVDLIAGTGDLRRDDLGTNLAVNAVGSALPPALGFLARGAGNVVKPFIHSRLADPQAAALAAQAADLARSTGTEIPLSALDLGSGAVKAMARSLAGLGITSDVVTGAAAKTKAGFDAAARNMVEGRIAGTTPEGYALQNLGVDALDDNVAIGNLLEGAARGAQSGYRQTMDDTLEAVRRGLPQGGDTPITAEPMRDAIDRLVARASAPGTTVPSEFFDAASHRTMTESAKRAAGERAYADAIAAGADDASARAAADAARASTWGYGDAVLQGGPVINRAIAAMRQGAGGWEMPYDTAVTLRRALYGKDGGNSAMATSRGELYQAFDDAIQKGLALRDPSGQLGLRAGYEKGNKATVDWYGLPGASPKDAADDMVERAGEGRLDALISKYLGGQSDSMAALRQSDLVLDPAQRQQLAASLLAKRLNVAGGDEAAKFVDYIERRAAPEFVQTMGRRVAGDELAGEWMRNLSRMGGLRDAVRSSQKFANHSNTSGNLMNYAILGSLGSVFVNPLVGVALAGKLGGLNVLSRALMSRRFADFLANGGSRRAFGDLLSESVLRGGTRVADPVTGAWRSKTMREAMRDVPLTALTSGNEAATGAFGG